MENANTLIRRILEKKDLDAAQAETLANGFLDGGLDEPAMQAALLALNEKGIAVDEITGFAQSMRRHAVTMAPSVAAMDNCGTGGDGAHTFNISTAASFVVAACGQPVAKHGNASVSGTCGSADVLREVGFTVDLPPERTKQMIEREGFGFLFAPRYHPAMKAVAPVRKALGVKTIFNLLGPLTNPANVKRQVIGVFGKENQEKIAAAAQALGTERTLVVRGENTDEAAFGKTTVLDVTQNGISRFEVDAAAFGIVGSLQQIQVSDAKQGALALRQALQNDEIKGKIVALNAALALMAAGKAQSVSAGVALAEKALESGKAMFKMIECVEAQSE